MTGSSKREYRVRPCGVLLFLGFQTDDVSAKNADFSIQRGVFRKKLKKTKKVLDKDGVMY